MELSESCVMLVLRGYGRAHKVARSNSSQARADRAISGVQSVRVPKVVMVAKIVQRKLTVSGPDDERDV